MTEQPDRVIPIYENPYIGERPLGLVQAHWSIERAYFKLLAQLVSMTDKQYVVREEVLALLADPAYDVPKPPKCNCGHEFSKDPKWWHLGGCAYREFYEG